MRCLSLSAAVVLKSYNTKEEKEQALKLHKLGCLFGSVTASVHCEPHCDTEQKIPRTHHPNEPAGANTHTPQLLYLGSPSTWQQAVTSSFSRVHVCQHVRFNCGAFRLLRCTFTNASFLAMCPLQHIQSVPR